MLTAVYVGHRKYLYVVIDNGRDPRLPAATLGISVS